MGISRLISTFFVLLYVGLPVLASEEDSTSVYFAQYRETARGTKELIFKGWTERPRFAAPGVVETAYPATVVEHEPLSRARIVELYGREQKAIDSLLFARGVDTQVVDGAADDEVFTLIDNGPVSNRIDLVFMGDGYTEVEKEKFLSDAKRLARDMFEGATFKSYLPIFNVHAVFRPSRESGIGKNSTPKDTAYGLYRVGNTLRAIFAAKPSAAHASCRQAPECNYPIIMGNDPYYGGLGGEFAITTSSEHSGTVVLRHELGHNFGVVGEEYDGGGYYGANHSSSVQSVSWRHWLSGTLREERSIARYIDWPWHNLAEGTFTARFQSQGTQWTHYGIDFSLSGVETDGDIEAMLDGQALPVKSPGHSDRAYHEYFEAKGFGSGNHELRFSEGVNDRNNMVASIKIHEYGSDYHFSDDYVSAYPLFTKGLAVDGYRPTHEGCLMRRMTYDRFCAVCRENNWLQFFVKISPIDSVRVEKHGGAVTVRVLVPKLGQFRRGAIPGERMEISWYRDGVEVPSLAGKFQWTETLSSLSGKWETEVRFLTPEVRHDPEKRLVERREIAFP